jgi:GNAT superfamily N-acetyltransferase
MRTLRPAHHEETHKVADLMRRSAAGLSAGFYDEHQTQLAAEFLTVPDLDLIADGTFYVVEQDGQIVGCGGWSMRRKLFTGSTDQEDLSSEWLDPTTEPAKIRAFFIDPDHARQGIARQIYEACESAALDKGFQALELMATLPGVPFYEKLGFRPLEDVSIDLPNAEPLPCVKMRKSLRTTRHSEGEGQG